MIELNEEQEAFLDRHVEELSQRGELENSKRFCG
jgi:hypothetical protein